MKKMMKILGSVSLLLLSACLEKTPPSFESGAGDLKFVKASNILDENNETTVLDRGKEVYFVLTDSAVSVDVTVQNQAAVVLKTTVRQKKDTIFIRPVMGNWPQASYYSFQIAAKLKNKNVLSFDLSRVGLSTEMWVVASNIYNVEAGTGYLDVDPNLDTFIVVFDQDIDRIEDINFTGTTTLSVSYKISDDTLKVIPAVRDLTPNQNYTLEFEVFNEDGVNTSIALDFHVAGDAFVPVATNANVVNYSDVGELTYGFAADGTLWVVFSDSLDADVSRIVWSNVASVSNVLYGSGDVTKINAKAQVVGDTLKVTPLNVLSNITNGESVGFNAKVYNKRGVSVNVTVSAYLAADQVYVVSTNVQDKNGLFRPFKVIGDSLVVTFSKPIAYGDDARRNFRVNQFVADYTVSWSKDSTKATIKNIDTLLSATYGENNPYEQGNVYTRAYRGLTFSLTTADGEETTVDPAEEIEIHTEYGMAIVGANILHKHTNQHIPVASNEEAMDTLAEDGVISIHFNRVLDTALIKAADENTHFILYDALDANTALPVAISFSKDLKTVTLDPVMDLKPRHSYYLRVMNVPGRAIAYAQGIGAHAGMASGLATSSRLSSDALMIYYKKVDISKLAMKIKLNSGALDSLATPGASSGLTNLENRLHFVIQKPAWNSHNADSVDVYQYRVRKVDRSGQETGWFYSTNYINHLHYDTSVFATSTSNPSSENVNLNISGESFFDELRTDARNSSDKHLFNDSSSIQIQLRVLHDDNKDGDYLDKGEQGAWSKAITYVDNSAPCDSRRVSGATMSSAASGGVSVALSIPSGGLDLSSKSSGAVMTYTFTFPEDMDIDEDNVPKVRIFWGLKTPSKAPTLTKSSSRWTSAKTYSLVYSLSAGVDYSAATTGGYWAASVAGMADASGILIASSGSVGDADNGTESTDVSGDSQGSRNLKGLQDLP